MKWKIIKLNFDMLVGITAIVSAIFFFSSELIADKIHYGFSLTMLMLYIMSDNNNGKQNKNTT